jgi:hypothetical protein
MTKLYVNDEITLFDGTIVNLEALPVTLFKGSEAVISTLKTESYM